MLAPWKKRYDQPRQPIKKQRCYFANRGPSSQGYDFSSSHVWMWELDHKEGWTLKNWWFWTVVLEKTLGSPLDSLSLSAIRVVSSAYLRLLIFLLAILIPACASSSPASLMMYSAHKLNKQGDNIQPWRTPFPIWNQSVVSCPVLTVASWPAYRFLKRQVRWSGMPISEFSTVYCDPYSSRLWHSQQSRNRCFSGTLLIFQWSSRWQFDLGSSAFSKTSLNIWKFMIYSTGFSYSDLLHSV